MSNLDGFDASQEEEMQDFSLLPAGVYEAVISESEMKDTKAGNGQYLAITFCIVAPDEFEGRFSWVNLNLDNPNETAVKIARSELAAICRATGIMQPKDSLDLHDIPIQITIKDKKNKKSGDMEAVIVKYEAVGTSKPAAAKTSKAPAKAPWKK